MLADVAIDQAGNAIALWVRRTDNFRVYRARYSASSTTWSGALPLSSSGIRAFYPHVEFDGSGNAIAVWVSEVDADHSVIKAARYVGVTDTWSPIVDISAPDRYAYWPELAVNASGDAMAVWTYGPRGAPGSVVQAARFNVASLSWIAPQTLSELVGAERQPARGDGRLGPGDRRVADRHRRHAPRAGLALRAGHRELDAAPQPRRSAGDQRSRRTARRDERRRQRRGHLVGRGRRIEPRHPRVVLQRRWPAPGRRARPCRRRRTSVRTRRP